MGGTGGAHHREDRKCRRRCRRALLLIQQCKNKLLERRTRNALLSFLLYSTLFSLNRCLRKHEPSFRILSPKRVVTDTQSLASVVAHLAVNVDGEGSAALGTHLPHLQEGKAALNIAIWLPCPPRRFHVDGVRVGAGGLTVTEWLSRERPCRV